MITNAKYTEHGSIDVIIDDMGNRHRIMIAKWEAET